MIKALIGAGGFAREVKAQMNQPDMISFVDDEYWNIYEKNTLPLSQFDSDKYIVCIAIGDPIVRKSMVEKLPLNTNYFTFIHQSAQILDDNIVIGDGSIICANCIITTNVSLGNHCQLNLSTTIGHDCIIGDYFTTAPGAKISGDCIIGSEVYLGTNSSIKQKVNICDSVIVGLNAGVVKNIESPGTYVGVPAKKIK